MLRIKANGDAALRMFKQMDGSIAKFQGGLKTVGNSAGSVFKGVSAVGGFLFKPLEIAAKAGGVLAAGLMSVGGAAIYAAAEDEKLVQRLSLVYGSVEKATKKFKELEAISRTTSFKTEDLTDAAIILEQVGMGGAKYLRTLGNAAKVSGGSISDMARSVSALQMRGLKSMGIESNEKDGKTTYRFRDQMGKVKTIVAKGADEARKALMTIFDLKFSGGTKGLLGLIEQLKNGIGQAFANFGDGLLPAAKRFVEWLSKGVNNLIEGGKLEEWGKKVGEWMEKAVDNVMAFFKTLPAVWEGLKKVWNEGGNVLKDLLMGVFSAGATILGVGLFEYLKATVSIWTGVGEMIGAGLMQAEGIKQLIYFATGKMPGATQQSALMQKGLKTAGAALPTAAANIAATASVEGQKLNQTFSRLSGVDVKSEFEKNLGDVQASRGAAQREMVTEQFRTKGKWGNTGWVEAPMQWERTSEQEAGKNKVGDVSKAGGIIVRIGTVQVTADNKQRMIDTLMQSAVQPALAAAGS